MRKTLVTQKREEATGAKVLAKEYVPCSRESPLALFEVIFLNI
jgi:hypothetical protein